MPLTVNMKCKELSLPVTQGISRLRDQNKSVREIAKTSGVARSTIWYILKKTQKPIVLGDRRIPSGEEKLTYNSLTHQENPPAGNNQEKSSQE